MAAPKTGTRPVADSSATGAASAIRRTDYTLSQQELDIRNHFREFFSREVPVARVRAAGDVGFDPELWRQLADLGALGMGLSTKRESRDSSVVELVLMSEELGRAIAPVPLIEATAAIRLLSSCNAVSVRPLLKDAAAGRRITVLALNRLPPGGRQLVPGGAVADAVVGLDGEDLVVVTGKQPPPHVPNQASAPLAWWDLSGSGGTRTVIASGKKARELHAGALEEWRLLTAAALVGLSDAALRIATEYAKQRHAFGVPIGTFQAVSHSLVDSAIAIEGGRHLNLRAAWYLEHEPAAARKLVPMAFAHACRAAYEAVTAAIHVHGAAGLLLESDIPLYFLRVRTWSVLAGDPQDELDSIADHLLGSRR
ncbi:MAG TPA: acyl-CoA dehydrogenase [Candidatus Nitrosotalea sp.]|nr:acyl-CoA dehydrogenase [Candidatus Nitrosotalea sp.]